MRTSYQIAISPGGVSFRIEPDQTLPPDWIRLHPERFDSQVYFNADGSLKERFSRLPIYAHKADD